MAALWSTSRHVANIAYMSYMALFICDAEIYAVDFEQDKEPACCHPLPVQQKMTDVDTGCQKHQWKVPFEVSSALTTMSCSSKVCCMCTRIEIMACTDDQLIGRLV